MRNIINTCLLLVLFSAGLVQNASAQNKLKNVTDGNSLMVERVFYADTLLIFCDTIYVLNKPTFNIYEAAYKMSKSKKEDIKELISHYDNLILKQEEIINIKEQYYQQLKSKFDSLASTATVFVDKSSANISQISSSLGRASDNLVETQKLLNDSQKLLEEERKNNWKRTLKVGVGGFTIGITVGLVLFLVAK